MIKTLKEVNNKFNKLHYVQDTINFDVKDYWQTPEEFVSKGSGDCEDFAIAKFFYLKDIHKLDSYVTYCMYELTQSHMVCMCDGFVLDNIVKDVLHFSKRTDLISLYKFNESDLILLRDFVPTGKRMPTTAMSMWINLLKRKNTNLTQVP